MSCCCVTGNGPNMSTRASTESAHRWTVGNGAGQDRIALQEKEAKATGEAITRDRPL